jgi:hypothetical protein
MKPIIFSQVVLSHRPPCDTPPTHGFPVPTLPWIVVVQPNCDTLYASQCLPVCCNTYTPIWTRVPHLLQTQGVQALALIFLFILKEQTEKRARFSDREL